MGGGTLSNSRGTRVPDHCSSCACDRPDTQPGLRITCEEPLPRVFYAARLDVPPERHCTHALCPAPFHSPRILPLEHPLIAGSQSEMPGVWIKFGSTQRLKKRPDICAAPRAPSGLGAPLLSAPARPRRARARARPASPTARIDRVDEHPGSGPRAAATPAQRG